MYLSIFGKKQNNTLNNILNLVGALLDSDTINRLLTNQKPYANAIYEMLLLLQTKGQQNRSKDWIDETLYYCADADVYTLLSSKNIISTIQHARLLDLSILPALKEKDSFSQQDLDTLVEQAIAKDTLDNLEETILPFLQEDNEMTFLLKKHN